jgi:hypothetical protein
MNSRSLVSNGSTDGHFAVMDIGFGIEAQESSTATAVRRGIACRETARVAAYRA